MVTAVADDPSVDPPANAPEDRPGPWAPLRVHMFRMLWTAGVVSNLGTFMHTVGAGWAITDLTDNPTIVSLLQTMWTAPGFLLALLAGALADVVDRRRLMLITQFASMVIAGVLAVLDLTGNLDVSALLVLTFLLSTAGTLAAPAFMAVTPELIDRPRLPQAIALNSISMNIAQAAGPALAGVVIALAGPGAVFAVNAASFLGIVVVLRQYRPTNDASLPSEHIWSAMRIGARYVRNAPRLQVLAARVVLSMIATSALAALLPIIARTRLGTSAGGFGLLSTAMGLGAILAVSVLPRLRARLGNDLIALAAAFVWSIGAATVAVTTSLPVACAGLALAGGASMTTMTTVFSLYQTQLPAWVRGRASSVAMLVIWLGASIGAAAWGMLGSAIGLRNALLAAALSNVAATAVAGVTLRIGEAAEIDLTPVHWAPAHAAVEPVPDDGPVLVTVEWRIDPTHVDVFAEAMVPVERQRRRDGAMHWGLFHDIAEPGRMVESFTVATWAEHERQHHRSVAEDRIGQETARRLLIADEPVVTHFVATRSGRQRRRSVR
jgi:MFS family permease